MLPIEFFIEDSKWDKNSGSERNRPIVWSKSDTENKKQECRKSKSIVNWARTSKENFQAELETQVS